MIIKILLISVFLVLGYLAYRVLKKNKAVRNAVAEGLVDEAKALSKKVSTEAKELVDDVKEKLDKKK